MKTTSLLNYNVITTTMTGAALFLAAGASAQTLYVSQGSSSAGDIYEYTSGGVQSTFAMGMDYPQGIAFDNAGDLFVANTAENAGESGNITKITPGGTPSTFASGIDPIALAFNNTGSLFEADYQSGNIYKYTGGTQSTFQTGFIDPISLAFDSWGDLFVGSGYGSGNGTITEISVGGTRSTFATGLTFPSGLAFNSAGDLFACNNETGVIYEYTSGGVRSTFATLSDTDLDGMAFNSAGDLFVTTGIAESIIEITPGGTPSTFVSGLSYYPNSLAFSGETLPVPEPSTLALLGIGASAVVLRLRRKK